MSGTIVSTRDTSVKKLKFCPHSAYLETERHEQNMSGGSRQGVREGMGNASDRQVLLIGEKEEKHSNF